MQFPSNLNSDEVKIISEIGADGKRVIWGWIGRGREKLKIKM
jgi:hypothetical protein